MSSAGWCSEPATGLTTGVGRARSIGPAGIARQPDRYTIRRRDGRVQSLSAADLGMVPAYDPETGNLARNKAAFTLTLGPVYRVTGRVPVAADRQ